MLLSLLAYLLAGVVCFVGLEKTVSEISDQNTWLVYSVLALLWCTTITWMLNSRKIRISIVDIAMAALLAWYLVSYHLNESVAITKVFEICFYISIYVSLRVLFSSHRNLGKFPWLLAVAGSCSRKQREATVVQRIFVGASLAVCICATAFATKPYLDRIEATKEWLDLRRWYSMERYSYVVDDYPELLPLMGENPTFLFEYGRSLNLEERYTESLEIMSRAIRLSNDPMNYNVIGNNYKAIGEYDKAAEAYLEAHYIIPSRMYPLYLLGKMYLEIGDREQAAHYARRVVAMTPKISSPATDDMQREMREVLSPEK